jgi:hypothetical protein
VGARASRVATVKYHYFYRFFTYSVRRGPERKLLGSSAKRPPSAGGRDPL